MKEHPIPQDITGYRFHIIGNMTLKQFVEIASGFVIAGILYKVGLPDYIKYPLMVLSAGIGALAAFIPIEDRPLDHWIITFFQVLSRPTQFYWKRMAYVPDIFSFQSSQPKINPDDEVDLNPVRRERIREFMASISPNLPTQNDFSAQESNRLSLVLQYFSDPSINSLLPQTTRPLETKPTLTVRVRKLRQESEETTQPAIPAYADIRTPVPDVVESPPLTDTYATPEPTAVNLTTVSQPPIDETNITTTPVGPATELSVVQPLTTTVVEIPNQQAPNVDVSSSFTSSAVVDVSLVEAPVSQTQPPQQAQTQTQFNSNLPFPSTPTEPNKLVGMVLSANGELVPGAIVEVVDEKGEIARAVKSNALGQFFITTPLPTGTYVIQVDKDDLQFATQNLEVGGGVLNPVELRALPS